MTSVDRMDEHQRKLVARFRDARAKLEEWKRETYPDNSVVYVECDVFKGHAIVAHHDFCPPDNISVFLQNESQLFPPVLSVCSAEHRMADWPIWIKRIKNP